jgi:hypothetical protein
MFGMEMPVSGVWAEAEIVAAHRRRGRMRRVRLVIRLDTPVGWFGPTPLTLRDDGRPG